MEKGSRRVGGSNPLRDTNFFKMELTNEQKQKAIAWYKKHSTHVLKLFDVAEVAYAPSEEDASFPELWKAEHWAWYMTNYVFQDEANKK